MESEVTAKLQKPRLRGVIHQGAFYVSLVVGVALVAFTESTKAAVAAAVFAISVSAMLGVSALYHRHEWTVEARRWLRKLDHSMIFLLIAGTYTPFALLVLNGTFADVVLLVVWAGALGGCIMELLRNDGSKWVMAIVCLTLGWVAVIALPGIAKGIGLSGTILLAAGGIAYTAGALIYATQKPDPAPAVFGYHEVFHTLVVFAVILQYAVVAFYVLPE
jgi:hemolysin III